MTPIARTSDCDPFLQRHEQEARLLGGLLRSSRLVLLFGESGSDKTALLKSELMPQLHRRATDRIAPGAPRESAVIIPFPDRRSRPASGAPQRRRELVVYFDDWSDKPLAALHAGIRRAADAPSDELLAPRASLAETIESLGASLEANFIVLLDRFEEFLLAPSDGEDRAQLANELVEAINRPRLPANFLLSLSAEAQPQLTGLRSRIHGFDDFSLKLAPPPQAAETPAAVSPELASPERSVAKVPAQLTEALPSPEPSPTPACGEAAAPLGRAPATPPRVKQASPPRAQVRTEDVYALIESTLARTASEAASESALRRNQSDSYRVEDTARPSREVPEQMPSRSRKPTGESGEFGWERPTFAGSKAPARTRGTMLRSMARWAGRLLKPKSKRRPGR